METQTLPSVIGGEKQKKSREAWYQEWFSRGYFAAKGTVLDQDVDLGGGIFATTQYDKFITEVDGQREVVEKNIKKVEKSFIEKDSKVPVIKNYMIYDPVLVVVTDTNNLFVIDGQSRLSIAKKHKLIVGYRTIAEQHAVELLYKLNNTATAWDTTSFVNYFGNEKSKNIVDYRKLKNLLSDFGVEKITFFTFCNGVNTARLKSGKFKYPESDAQWRRNLTHFNAICEILGERHRSAAQAVGILSKIKNYNMEEMIELLPQHVEGCISAGIKPITPKGISGALFAGQILDIYRKLGNHRVSTPKIILDAQQDARRRR